MRDTFEPFQAKEWHLRAIDDDSLEVRDLSEISLKDYKPFSQTEEAKTQELFWDFLGQLEKDNDISFCLHNEFTGEGVLIASNTEELWDLLEDLHPVKNDFECAEIRGWYLCYYPSNQRSGTMTDIFELRFEPIRFKEGLFWKLHAEIALHSEEFWKIFLDDKRLEE